MRFALFYHSLYSDWNHGNAHFLRGIARELIGRGHEVRIFEPRDGWSASNLLAHEGREPIRAFRRAFPELRSIRYLLKHLDLDCALHGVDVVLVHEWNDPRLVQAIGQHHGQNRGYQLLFHDTHHRSASAPQEMARYDLSNYDAVLAFGAAVQDIYLRRGWASRVFVWHEAADTSVFRPLPRREYAGDVAFIGNGGDDERNAELREFLIEPVRRLGLCARVYGVRYGPELLREMADAGVDYAGWLPNLKVAAAFAGFRATVHIPRRHYLAALPGIPTIRVFEALACGIPLISAKWTDCDGLFAPGKDFLVAGSGDEMTNHLRAILREPQVADRLAAHGLATVRARHTCAHRVDELLEICRSMRPAVISSRRPDGMRIAFFGSSLVSAYWNGAATYYRGLIRALNSRGHRVTFYEPDAFERQKHRDIADPPYARVVVYDASDERGVRAAIEGARSADVIVKASGVGIFDSLLEAAVLDLRRPGARVIFWDVDAPATLQRLTENPDDPFRPLVPEYDLILTYGGGDSVVRKYAAFGARRCVPVYNALDTSTHYPVSADDRFSGELALLANRLPDRETRILEFFFEPARQLPSRRFLLGGAGWNGGLPDLPNVSFLGHVYTRDHNAFNSSPLAILNVNRESMARNGYSPATRLFEAAGAAACIITDHWDGIDTFLTPGAECLVAEDGAGVVRHLENLSTEQARQIGRAAAQRIRREHTYEHRAVAVEALLSG